MNKNQVPFVTACCGEGCGRTLKVAWLDRATLSPSAQEQFERFGKVVSHGMCEECQLKYYGKVYA